MIVAFIPFIIIGFILWNILGVMFAMECLLIIDDDIPYTFRRTLKTLVVLPFCGPFACLFFLIDFTRNMVNRRKSWGQSIRRWLDKWWFLMDFLFYPFVLVIFLIGQMLRFMCMFIFMALMIGVVMPILIIYGVFNWIFRSIFYDHD